MLMFSELYELDDVFQDVRKDSKMQIFSKWILTSLSQKIHSDLFINVCLSN